jgi:hypothetical protein
MRAKTREKKSDNRICVQPALEWCILIKYPVIVNGSIDIYN